MCLELALLCSAPRANFCIRSQPPEQVQLYAAAHEIGVWKTLCALIGRTDLEEEVGCDAALLSQLPLRMGGCGLRSALRSSPAAYWVSWADTLPMLKERSPQLAVQLLEQLDGTLPTPRKMSRMSDEELIENLCSVRGIGPWTVQMHLIFYLGRPDVMPATDLAVQKGVRNVYGMADMPSPKELMSRTDHLAPYRSAAAWYFWRASEIEQPLG